MNNSYAFSEIYFQKDVYPISIKFKGDDDANQSNLTFSYLKNIMDKEIRHYESE